MPKKQEKQEEMAEKQEKQEYAEKNRKKQELDALLIKQNRQDVGYNYQHTDTDKSTNNNIS